MKTVLGKWGAEVLKEFSKLFGVSIDYILYNDVPLTKDADEIELIKLYRELPVLFKKITLDFVEMLKDNIFKGG